MHERKKRVAAGKLFVQDLIVSWLSTYCYKSSKCSSRVVSRTGNKHCEAGLDSVCVGVNCKGRRNSSKRSG